MDDDDRLQAYIETQKMMGQEDQLIDDVAEFIGMPPPSPGMRKIIEQEMTSMRGGPKNIEDELEDLIKAGRQKDADLARVEEKMADPKNIDKMMEPGGFEKLMQEVQDEKIIPFKPKKAEGGRIHLKEGSEDKKGLMQLAGSAGDPPTMEDADEHSFRLFNKPYKELTIDELDEFKEEMDRLRSKFMADGGRVDLQLGGLAKLLAKMGMKAPDKVGDVKQVKNIIRDPETDLTRKLDTPEGKITIDELEQMFMDDPRYRDLGEPIGKNQKEILKIIDKEKIRADVSYNLGVEPEEIPDDMIEMLYRDGYHNQFANGGKVTSGVGSLFKRRV